MTFRQLNSKLTSFLEQRDIDAFFDFLNEKEYYIKTGFLEEVKHEWQELRTAIKMKAMPKDQAVITFKISYDNLLDKYTDPLIEKLNHVLTEEIEAARLEHELIEEEKKATVSNHYYANEGNIRPTVMTIACIIGFLTMPIGFLTGLVILGISNNIEIALFTILSTTIGFSHYYGLWKMKKWSLIIYVLNLLLAVGAWIHFNSTYEFSENFYAFLYASVSIGVIVNGIYITLLAYYYRRMR